MGVLITIVKIFISIILGYLIMVNCKIQDTSAIQALRINSEGIVNKIFSPKSLSNMEISFKKLSIPYNTFSVFALFGVGIAVSIIMFFICFLVFKIKSIAFIIAIPTVFSPFWVLNYIADYEQNKLESGLNDFFIQLKSALRINPDIIEALRRIQNIALEPFASYTKQLLIEVNAGKLPEVALEGFAQKVNIKKFSFYINNVRHCQIYGGDITTLTEKTQQILADAMKQKKKRIKETKSICMVLYILIVIDIYMYFNFICNNEYYLQIMTNSFIGKSILNINFLSIWGIVWLSKVVKKFDY